MINSVFGSPRKIIKNCLLLLNCLRYKAPINCKIYWATVVKNVKFEGRNMIGKHSVVTNTYLGYGSAIVESSRIISTSIGKYSAIGPNVRIISGRHPSSKHVSIHPAFYSIKKQFGYTYVKKQMYDEHKYADIENGYLVKLGNDVWIGDSAKIMEGVTISDGAIVAADALVLKDVPPFAIVAGVPAKLIRYRFESEDINYLLSLKWWEKDLKWITEYSKYFNDINSLKNNINLED